MNYNQRIWEVIKDKVKEAIDKAVTEAIAELQSGSGS